jgi:lysophospholipase L1-like esterase
MIKISIQERKVMVVGEVSKTTLSHKLVNLCKNLLVLLISLVLVLCFCELVLRVYNPLGFRIKGNKIILPINKKEIIHHEHGLGKLDKVVIVQRNSLGFRGPEPPADFARSLTIATVGGSTTECLDLAEDKTWPHDLGVRLKPNFKHLWIDNAGLSGNSTFGHYILMQDYLVKLQPKVVLFLVGINDVGLKSERDFDERIHEINFRSLERFLASAAVHSELATAALNLYRFYFPKSVMINNQNDPQETDLRKLLPFSVSHEEQDAIIKDHQDHYLSAYKNRLEKLIAICQEHNIIPVLLTQPVLYGNSVDPTTGVNLGHKFVAKDMDGATGWQVLELYNDVTRHVGRDRGVLVIDLAREMPKDSRYYYDLMHYTNPGAEKVADLIAAQLTPLLARKFPQYYKESTTSRTATP